MLLRHGLTRLLTRATSNPLLRVLPMSTWPNMLIMKIRGQLAFQLSSEVLISARIGLNRFWGWTTYSYSIFFHLEKWQIQSGHLSCNVSPKNIISPGICLMDSWKQQLPMMVLVPSIRFLMHLNTWAFWCSILSLVAFEAICGRNNKQIWGLGHPRLSTP